MIFRPSKSETPTKNFSRYNCLLYVRKRSHQLVNVFIVLTNNLYVQWPGTGVSKTSCVTLVDHKSLNFKYTRNSTEQYRSPQPLVNWFVKSLRLRSSDSWSETPCTGSRHRRFHFTHTEHPKSSYKIFKVNIQIDFV